jgi:hypothetical protein
MNINESDRWVMLDSLELWKENYRKHDLAAIVKSIRAFGYNGVVCTKGNVVYAGNGQVKALRQLREDGAAMPQGIIATPAGDWLIPVIPLDHLSDKQAEAFGIAANRTQQLGRDDEEALANLLAGLVEEDGLLEGLAYSEDELKSLLGSFEPEPDSDQGNLDTKSPIRCPNCGHEFFQ